MTGSGTLFNLSLTGCAVQSDTAVSDKMLVTLRLTPFDGSPPITIEMARVRWGTMQEFGVEFSIIHREEREKLEWLLRTAATKPASTDALPSKVA